MVTWTHHWNRNIEPHVPVIIFLKNLVRQFQGLILYFTSTIFETDNAQDWFEKYFKCSSNVGVMWDPRYQSNIVSSKEISYSSLHLLVVISDAQLPDTLRVVHTNLAQASQFWTFWYQNLYKEGFGHETEGRIPPPHRTTRQTVSVDENTTPYFLPTSVDRERGKIWHKKKTTTRTRSKLKQSGEGLWWSGLYWWVGLVRQLRQIFRSAR